MEIYIYWLLFQSLVIMSKPGHYAKALSLCQSRLYVKAWSLCTQISPGEFMVNSLQPMHLQCLHFELVSRDDAWAVTRVTTFLLQCQLSLQGHILQSARSHVNIQQTWVNSAPELDFLSNSNSRVGIGIQLA